MMNNKNRILTIIYLILLGYGQLNAQSESLTSSPYSLYGLGLSNKMSTGKANALGHSGIARFSTVDLNSLNPASYATIHSNSFFYDIGLKGQYASYNENNYKKNELTGNFSSLAFGFSVTKNSGIGLTLLPYTSIGYSITGIESDVEGYDAKFLSDFNGSGGLNNLKLNYGYSIGKALRLGVFGSFLFGNIEQTESSTILGSEMLIDETNSYSGFRGGVGLQYDLTKNVSFGGIVSFPSNLNGKQSSEVTISETVISSDDGKLKDYKLPLEIGFGTYFKVKERFLVSLDYRKNFWTTTNQSDNIGDFVNQQIYNVGLEYIPLKKTLSYFSKINYRAGFSYDDGNLKIGDTRISNYEFNLGLGLPLSEMNNSVLNITYSYGKLGQVSNNLIKENYHSIGVNLSLEDIWFVKRKIN